MKIIKATMLILLCVSLIICLAVISHAESKTNVLNTITYSEITDLLSRAFDAFDRVHREGAGWSNDGVYYLGKIPDEYNTVEKMSKYFRTIYTDDIADSAWMYAFSPTSQFYREQYPVRMDENGNILIFSEKTDGTIDICDAVSTLGGWINGWDWVKSVRHIDNYPCESIFDIKGDSQHSSALVLICYSEYDYHRVVTVEVRFENTEKGWRICDCDMFRAMHTNKNQPSFSSDYPIFSDYATDLINKINESHNYYGDIGLVKNIEFTADSMTAIYQIWNNDKKAYEWYDLKHQKTSQGWTATGGALMDLAEGKTDVAPFTGDSSFEIIIVLSVIGLSFYSTLIIINRNKHIV